MSVMRRQEFGSPWRLGLSFPRELTLADIAATHWLLVKVLSPSDSRKPLYGTANSWAYHWSVAPELINVNDQPTDTEYGRRPLRPDAIFDSPGSQF
jgi:hypothetical protein